MSEITLKVYNCSQCGYEVVSNATVNCPNCGIHMVSAADAGLISSPWKNEKEGN